MIEIPEFQGTHLSHRVCWAKKNLRHLAEQPEFVIVWEDPKEIEAPCKITWVTPEFVAAAKHGGILPAIDAYVADKKTVERWSERNGSQGGFNWADWSAQHPYTSRLAEPMNHEGIVSYVLQKDLPTRVLEDGNKPRYRIIERAKLPKNRLHRNAWEFEYSSENPIQPNFEKAKALQKDRLISHFINRDNRAREIEPYIYMDDKLKVEFNQIKAANPETSFDRLSRAKTLSDLNRAMPAELVSRLFFDNQEGIC